MKPALLSALVYSLLASPLMAHTGPHMYPHSTEVWGVGLATLLVIGATAIAAKARK